MGLRPPYQTKTYARVDYETVEGAVAAVSKMNGVNYCGVMISVSFVKTGPPHSPQHLGSSSARRGPKEPTPSGRDGAALCFIDQCVANTISYFVPYTTLQTQYHLLAGAAMTGQVLGRLHHRFLRLAQQILQLQSKRGKNSLAM